MFESWSGRQINRGAKGALVDLAVWPADEHMRSKKRASVLDAIARRAIATVPVIPHR